MHTPAFSLESQILDVTVGGGVFPDHLYITLTIKLRIGSEADFILVNSKASLRSETEPDAATLKALKAN